jgi:hypothetical protein
MPRYVVTGLVTISVHTVVEAKNKAQAIALADERALPSLCHQCGSAEGANERWCTSGELDGSIEEMEAEKQ